MVHYDVSTDPSIVVGWDPGTCEFWMESERRVYRAPDLASVDFRVRAEGSRIPVSTTEALLLDRRHTLEAVEVAA